MSGRTRPLEKFSQAVAKCTVESAAYGKCVVGSYQNVSKDMCLQEFLRLKDCYVAAASRKK